MKSILCKGSIIAICCSFLIIPFVLVYGLSKELVYALILCILLIYISIVDFIEHRIYNKTIIIFLSLCLIDMIHKPFILQKIFIFLLFGSILIPMKIKFTSFMGSGDIKLICISALLLGYHVITAYLIAVLLAACVAVILIFSRHATHRSRMALGPYLACGIWIMYMEVQGCLLLHNLF